jgi:preprotein translocase subunit YajC
MSTILLLNPIEGIAQAVESESVMTFVQTEDVNLAEPSASAKSGKTGSMGSMSIIWILLLLVLMFIMMRPRKDKEGDKFRNALQREQEVVTSSGIFGKIKDMDDISVTLEISQNNRIRVDKRYVNPVPTVQPVKESKKKEERVPNKEEKA